MLNFQQDPLEKAEQEGTLPDANPYPEVKTVVGRILSNSNGILIGDDGLTLDTSIMSQPEFTRFFQWIVSSGGYFLDFNGELYNKIMACNEWEYAAMGKIRIAREIQPFPEECDFFSKRIRKDRDAAHFEFGPFIRSADPEVEWSEDKKYDFSKDEIYGLFFRAGIFGWFEVHTIAANSQWLDHFEIRVIAKRVEPISGQEAVIDELRDLRPVRSIKIVDKQTGTADMKRCECAFPQVSEIGERLLKKSPAKPGTNGVQIDGKLIAFKMGKDVNFTPLAGKGTEIQKELDGTEYVVSTRTWYVSIERGRTIEITNEKKNYLPIWPQMGGSIRVTEGVLHQHGDIIHGYELEVDSLIMPSSSVFGTLIVNQGDYITSGFAGEGSRIRVANGNVKVARATKARIDALSGSIHIPVAENSVIIGNEVHIDNAYNTIVIANVANIGKCHGWSVYAPSIQIGRSQRMARVETAIVCPIYDIRSERKTIRKLEMEIQHEKQALENFVKREAELRTNSDLQQYIRITQAIKAKTFQPTADQQPKMIALQKKVRPIIEELRNLPEKHKDILTKIEQIEKESQEKMAKLEEHIKQIQQWIRMQIDELESGVGVRVWCVHTYLMPTNIKAVGEMPESEGDMLISMVLDYLNAGTTQLGTEKLLDVGLGGNVSADFETFKEIGRKNHSHYTGRLSRSLDGKAEARSENRYLILSSQTFLRHMHEPEGIVANAEYGFYSAKLDYRYQAWLSDITSEWASFLIPKKQEFTPFFEQDEDILIHLSAFGETYRLPFIIRYYQDMGEMYKIGGPFIFAHGMDMQNRMFQLRNSIERHRIKESAFTRY